MDYQIKFSKTAEKQRVVCPVQVRRKLRAWILSVKNNGMALTRLAKGYHDEPLQGNRKGQRSVRLNRQWRLIYTQDVEGHHD